MNPAEDLCDKTFLLTTESVCKIHLSNVLGKNDHTASINSVRAKHNRLKKAAPL